MIWTTLRIRPKRGNLGSIFLTNIQDVIGAHSSVSHRRWIMLGTPWSNLSNILSFLLVLRWPQFCWKILVSSEEVYQRLWLGQTWRSASPSYLMLLFIILTLDRYDTYKSVGVLTKYGDERKNDNCLWFSS